MKGSILKRLETLEQEVNAGSEIPAQEKVIAIPYPADGDEEGFERLKQEKLEKLKEKYGALPDDLLVIRIRQFYRKEKRGTCMKALKIRGV